MANTANILGRYRREADASSAEAGRNSAAANRENTATGEVETGVAVIGAAIGGPVTDSSSPVDLVIRTTGIGTLIGDGAFLTRITAIILISIIRMTVAPYQEGNSLGPDSGRALSAKPLGVGAMSQRLIPTGDRSSLLPRMTGLFLRLAV